MSLKIFNAQPGLDAFAEVEAINPGIIVKDDGLRSYPVAIFDFNTTFTALPALLDAMLRNEYGDRELSGGLHLLVRYWLVLCLLGSQGYFDSFIPPFNKLIAEDPQLRRTFQNAGLLAVHNNRFSLSAYVSVLASAKNLSNSDKLILSLALAGQSAFFVDRRTYSSEAGVPVMDSDVLPSILEHFLSMLGDETSTLYDLLGKFFNTSAEEIADFAKLITKNYDSILGSLTRYVQLDAATQIAKSRIGSRITAEA